MHLEAPNEFGELLVSEQDLPAVKSVLQRFVGVERRWVISILLYIDRGQWQPQFKWIKWMEEEGDIYNTRNLAEILMPAFMSGSNPTTYLGIAHSQELIEIIRRNTEDDEAISKIKIAGFGVSPVDDSLVRRVNGLEPDSGTSFSFGYLSDSDFFLVSRFGNTIFVGLSCAVLSFIHFRFLFFYSINKFYLYKIPENASLASKIWCLY